MAGESMRRARRLERQKIAMDRALSALREIRASSDQGKVENSSAFEFSRPLMACDAIDSTHDKRLA